MFDAGIMSIGYFIDRSIFYLFDEFLLKTGEILHYNERTPYAGKEEM